MNRLMRVVASLSICLLASNGAFAAVCRVGYASPRSYDRGLALRIAVQTGDFDGDGRVDIASLHRYGVNEGNPDRAGTILLNRGNGAFEQLPLIAPGDFSTIQVGNLDNDGILDLVLGGSSSLTWLYGNGNGTFRVGGTAEVRNVTSIALGQFDGRNGIDIAVAQASPPALTILLADANGNYSTFATYPLDNAATAVATADFDGDGRADLVVADQKFVTPFFGNGDGTFTKGSPLPTLATLSLATHDMDRDGRPDIVVGGQKFVTVFVYAGSRQFLLSRVTSIGTDANTIAVTDVDHDANPDVVVVGNGDIAVLRGAPGGGFLPAATYAGGANPVAGAMGDFNGDGFNDVVVSNLASADISILQNLGNGDFDAMRKLDAGDRPVAFATGDVNHDQHPDLIVGNQLSNDITVFRSNDAGGFDPPEFYSLTFGPKSIKLGDVDGDGNLDIAALSADGSTVGVLFGSPAGKFHDLITIPFAQSLCCIELSDLNGDHRDDLIYAEDQRGVFGVLLSNIGSFGPPTTYLLPNGATALASGDLDNDSNRDVIVATALDVFTFRGSPSGALTPYTTLGIKDTNAIAVGALNKDSFPDLVIGSTEVIALFGDPSGTFQSRVHLGVPADKVTAVAIADLDGDGVNDIAATLYRIPLSEHFVTTYLQHGFQFEAQPAVQTEAVPSALAVADLTNDKIPDLVVGASGKGLFARARCAPPAVTVGVPRFISPGQPFTIVANVVAGAARNATLTILVDGVLTPGTQVNPLEPGIARATVTLGAGTHTITAVATFPEGEGASSDPLKVVISNPRRRAVRK
jgi:FG-GAP-like repeat